MSSKSRAAAVSVASNAFLVVLKVAVGMLSGSVSVISEAIHSANDLLAAAVAFVSVRASDRAPDEEHPYGHGKIEALSSAFEAGLILLAAVWIAVEAIRKILGGARVERPGAGTAVMIVSVVVNTAVSRYLFRVAKREESLALATDANHLATDVYTSVGVAAGLAVVSMTGWQIVDPIAAIAVALLIAKIGVSLTLEAGEHLIDTALPEADQAIIRSILHRDPRVVDVHRYRTRRSGSSREIEAHITLDAALSFREAHAIAQELERSVARAFTPPARVLLHPDPAPETGPGPGKSE